MIPDKNDARLICYASIIVLSLVGCSHQGGKVKGQDNISENQSAATTPENNVGQNSGGKKSGRWHRRKDGSLVAGGKKSSQYDNLWERLFDLYDLPPINHPDIDRELEWFASHPDYLNRVQQRAKPFLYSIVKQVEKQDIPGEIALLPVIESAFQPHAVSPARAAGIWQFIPSTGKNYGLKKSRTYDGRRDVYASTKAAIKYLKKLHGDFNGDWLLAIAAYNCGEGAVGRAIQKNAARNLPTDFWSLDLPQETRAYVPRLLAVSRLFASADQYGVDLHDIPNAAKYKPVKVSTQIDLALAADAADMSLDKLYELNPGFKGKYAEVPGSFHLFIPAEKKTSEFRQKLEKLVLENQSAIRYDRDDPNLVVNRDETPSASAYSSNGGRNREARVPVSEGGQNGDQTFRQKERRESREIGTLKQEERGKDFVKVRTAPEPSAKSSGINPLFRATETDEHRRTQGMKFTGSASPDLAMKKTNYIVQPGETLWAVARKNSVDVDQLAKWNQFPVTTNVKTGQVLVVWSKDAGRKLPFVESGIRPSQSIRYVVQEGDTLFSISRRFNVSVTELRKWNGSNIEKQMQPGRNITVPKDKD